MRTTASLDPPVFQSKRVVETASVGPHAREARDGRRREVVGRGPIPELTVEVGAPAFDATVDEGTGVIAADQDRLDAAAESADRDRHGTIDKRVVS